jgi:hypothetical protein
VKDHKGEEVTFERWLELAAYGLRTGEDGGALYDVMYGRESGPYWDRLRALTAVEEGEL